MYGSAVEAIASIHNELWRRFVRNGVVLDYTDFDGHTVLPAKADCDRAIPNAFGWWTPIENGAFFTGLYVAGLVNGDSASSSHLRRARIASLIEGLCLLQDVGKTDGFIARGVADDGVSHYPCGSEDQTAPWLFGMWKAASGERLSSERRSELRARIMRVIRALARNDWKIPSEWEGEHNGHFGFNRFVSSVRLLFACRIAAEITREAGWMELYYKFLYERPKGGLHGKPEEGLMTRIEICRHGFAVDLAAARYPKQFWILTGAQAALRELCRLEKDPDVVAAYRQGLETNGIVAFHSLERYKEHDNDKDYRFDVNWRPLVKLWHPHQTVSQSRQIALEEHELWVREMVDMPMTAHGMLNDVVHAHWIAQLSMNKEVIVKAGEILKAMLRHIDWRKLYIPCGFVAECAYYEYLKNVQPCDHAR